MRQHVAVLAFTDGNRQPRISALHAIDSGFHRPIIHAVDGNSVFELREIVGRHAAFRAYPVAADPTVGRKLEMSRQCPVVG